MATLIIKFLLINIPSKILADFKAQSPIYIIGWIFFKSPGGEPTFKKSGIIELKAPKSVTKQFTQLSGVLVDRNLLKQTIISNKHLHQAL
jgi:hypothetical protein